MGRGFDLAGMTCVFQCEKNPRSHSVLARHYPDVPKTHDVASNATLNLVKGLRPDLLAFGFPCQDLSSIGRRAGLAGDRSGLFFRCADIVEASLPKWVVIENVAGLLSSHKGRDMATVLGTLEELGYGYAYRVFDAKYFGVPQRRRRVFIVGCIGDYRRAAEVLFQPEVLRRHPKKSNKEGQESDGYFAKGTGKRYPIASTSGQQSFCLTAGGMNRRDLETETMIIMGRYNEDGEPVDLAMRKLTVTEAERLQGFPDGYTEFGDDGKVIADSARYTMIGNAVCVPVAKRIGGRIMVKDKE